MCAAVYNAQSTRDKQQWRDELDRSTVPAPTKTQEVQALDAKQLPHQWKFETQEAQRVPGMWWRLYERVPVQQTRLTVNKTKCCWRQKDSAQCWICGVAICETCSQGCEEHNVLFQKLIKTSWCPDCLVDAIHYKGCTSAKRVRCINDECQKMIYSKGYLPNQAAAYSQVCFDAWQRVKKDEPDCGYVASLEYDQTPHVDVIEACSTVGVFQGNWKDSAVYLDRIKKLHLGPNQDLPPLDTSSLEEHIKSRTVSGELLWPLELERPQSHFDMLMHDIKADVKDDKPEVAKSEVAA